MSRFQRLVGVNRLSAMNLLYGADLKQDVDFTILKGNLTNTYEIIVNEKTSRIIGKMMMLSKV